MNRLGFDQLREREDTVLSFMVNEGRGPQAQIVLQKENLEITVRPCDPRAFFFSDEVAMNFVETVKTMAVQINDAFVENTARMCHEVNRVLQVLNGEETPSWDEVPASIRESARDGVRHMMLGATPEESHKNWLKFKQADGWVYGPEKNLEKKTHPCMVRYEDLPPEQKIKDLMFQTVVHEQMRLYRKK